LVAIVPIIHPSNIPLLHHCLHIEHVRTQLPYALTTGAVAIFFGTLPAFFGISPWILFPLGFPGLYFIVHFFGKPSELNAPLGKGNQPDMP